MAAQEQTLSEETVASIVGEWEGSIRPDETSSFDVIWRFELSDAGKLVGFMGPASQGIATLPMQDIVVTDSALSFSVAGVLRQRILEGIPEALLPPEPMFM